MFWMSKYKKIYADYKTVEKTSKTNKKLMERIKSQENLNTVFENFVPIRKSFGFEFFLMNFLETFSPVFNFWASLFGNLKAKRD